MLENRGRNPVATKISGSGAFVPGRKVTNDDVLGMLKDSSRAYLSGKDFEKLVQRAERLLEKAGSRTRYWCERDQYCTDIAKLASERALEDAEVKPSEIDLIIFTGMSKAFVEPATAHVLRHEIGAVNANVIDTQDACTSFLKSLDIADSLIRSGRYRNILLATGERTYDWADFTCKTVYELDWKFGSLTIGDAAGALVLQPTEDPLYTENSKHMRFFNRIEDGTYAVCHIGLNHRVGERYRLHSHSSRLIRTGLKVLMEMLVDILQEEEWQDFQFDNLFIHDVGKIIDEIVLPTIKKAEICVPDSYRSFFPEYGNVACASLPLSICLAKDDGRLQRGNQSVFVCPAAGVQAACTVFVY